MLRANWGKRSEEFRGTAGVGVRELVGGNDGGTVIPQLTRRSAQEKSFFFPGAQLAGRPAASVRGGDPVYH